MANKYRGAIFDLDGTLLDTIEDLADSTNHALAAEGLPTHSLAAYRYFVGDGVESLLRRAAPGADGDQVKRLVDGMRARYAEIWSQATRPYSGIPEMLSALAARNIKMAILSNKPDDFTRLIVAHYFPDTPFAAVQGQRPGGPKKPDPTGAREIMARFALPAGEILYFGDTDTDMKTAQAAGLRAIGVAWGFRPVTELEEAGADAIIAAPGELLRWF